VNNNPEEIMKDDFENKLTMYKTVETLFNNNSAKTTPIAALATSIANFKSMIDEIEKGELERKNATTGRSESKAAAKSALVSEAITIAAAVRALGSVTNNQELIAAGDISSRKLTRARDTDVVLRTQSIHNYANANAAALTDYGVTPAMIVSLQTRITAYDSKLGTREEGTALREAAGRKVKSFFEQADVILAEQIDGMMEIFRGSDTQFFNEYRSARVIRDV
jgi:hypothetical protein